MSYNEVRGTGLAAVCPVIEEGSTNLKDIKPGSYKLRNMCLEPTKIMVRPTYIIKVILCSCVESSNVLA